MIVFNLILNIADLILSLVIICFLSKIYINLTEDIKVENDKILQPANVIVENEEVEIISEIEKGKSIGIFIGPEGGFDDDEIEQANECGFKPITLGNRILRTETAGLAILAMLVYELE